MASRAVTGHSYLVPDFKSRSGGLWFAQAAGPFLSVPSGNVKIRGSPKGIPNSMVAARLAVAAVFGWHSEG